MSRYEDLKKKRNSKTQDEKEPEQSTQSRYQKLKANRGARNYGVDDNYINTFLQDAQSFLNSSQDEWNGLSWQSATDTQKNRSREETWSDLNSRSSVIRAYLNANKSNLDEDTYNELTSYLDSLKSANNDVFHSFRNAEKYYSQWDSEDAYVRGAQENREVRQKRYEDNKKRIEELNAQRSQAAAGSVYNPDSNFMMPIFNPKVKQIDDEIEALEAENLQYERGEGGFIGKRVDDNYKVTQNSDFAITSANRDYTNASKEELWNYDMSVSEGSEALNNGGYFDEDGNIRDSKGNIVQNANAPAIEDKLGMFLNATDEEKTEAYNMLSSSNGNYNYTWGDLVQEGDQGSWKYLSDTELGIYYTYLGESQEKAYQFLSDMKTELNRRQTLAETGQWYDAYEEANFLEKIAMSAATTPAKFVSTVAGFVEDTANTVMGNEINPYSAAHSGMHYSQTVRGARAEELDATGIKIPGIDFTLGDLYQTGMSRMDSALATSIFGGGGTVFLGMGAAQEEAYRLYQQGASAEQITLDSFAAGAAEAVFEYVSFGKLTEITDVKTLRQLVKSVLIQGWNEATEEALTEVSNIITNAIVMGGQSDLAAMYKENKGNAWNTFLGLVKQTAHSAFGGFVGGTMAGSVQAGKSYDNTQAQYRRVGNEIKRADGGVNALKDLANEVAGVSDTKIKNRLTNQAGKVDDQSSARRVGKLYDAVQTANNLSNASANQADIAKSLQRKGFTEETANDIAAALVASYNGQELTKAQRKLLESAKDSKVVQDAISNIMTNEQSTMGQRSKNIDNFWEDVDSGIKAKKLGVSTDVVKNAKKGIYAPEAESSTEGSYEVSVEGKTILKSDPGKTVNIKRIASIEKGKIVFETDDGNVDASDISFATKDEALIYEAVANLGGIINADDANRLVQGFSKAEGMSAAVYARGVAQAYTYGYYGYSMADAKGKDTMSSALTDSQRNTAFAFGRVQRKTDAVEAQKSRAKYRAEYEAAANDSTTTEKKGGVHFRTDSMEVSDIDSYLEKAGTVLKDVQKVSIETMKDLSEALGIEFYVYESYVKGGKRYYIDENGNEQAGAPNGWYDKATGKIYIDLHAGAGGRGVMLFTIAHELTHFIHQWSPERFTNLADIIFKHGNLRGKTAGLVAEKMRKAKERGKPITYEVAYEEVVADAMESILKSGRVMEMVADVKQQDRGAWQAICEWFKNLADKLKRLVATYDGLDPDSFEGKAVADMKGIIKEIEAIYADALVDASKNYQSFMAMAESTEIQEVGEGTMFSYSSLAEAAGFTAVENADGSRSFTREGAKVTKVTVEDIENSPIGAFINYSLDKKDISKADADRQKKMFADICTMACKTNDFSMTMQFVGSAVFTGMKANADKQYGTTYDFPSICTKTQAVIDAMSAKMVKIGRGLKSDEIVELYRDVFASGNPVPCPECYVFSRWIGIGGLLDNIKKYQDYYGKMDVSEVAKAYLKMKAEVSAFAEEQGISFGKAKGALTSKLTKEYNKLTEKIEKAQNQGERVKPADQKRLEELEPMMNTVKGMTWLENVYFADSSLKKVNPKYKVPDSVLFDLNNGEAFASQYKEAWAFRTTQGAGYGKAITPYAEAKLGEGILTTNNTTNTIKGKANGTLDNYFLKQNGTMDKKAKEALNRARLKQKIQAFIGGQRFQSTSDARYENASDYLLAALEMQAMRGMVQVYTKVDGAVPAFSAWGFSINQSLMPLGGGLDADGNVKDTSVGGMNPKVAFENRNKHESAGTITIGVNDNHIREMFKQWVRDFIIPYHASGGKADVVAELRRIQEGDAKKGKMVRSTDYSRTQSDKVLSDEVLRWQGKTDAEINRIHQVRDARIAILTGGKPNMDVVRGNRFLSALYDKLNGGEWDGVKLAKSKVESQIFPNEFWDQTVSYEESGKVTRDYLEYCDDLGFLHRFSGMIPSNGKLVPVNGYDQNGERVQLTDLAYKYDENGQKTDEVEEFFWKVLTDRRMYDNEGNYLPQKIVTLNDTTTDTVTGFAKNNVGKEYNKELSDQLVKQITSSSMYSYRGTNQYGIEVYETSQATMNLSWTDRRAKYLDVMSNLYYGRTAKFVRNGHVYYAEFDQSSIRKHIFGDKRSSKDGVKALIKAGADGDVFDLVEKSRYTRSQKNKKNHTNADYFDYFVKTVQIDGKVFDLVADVEKKYGANGGYVYTLALVDNNTIKASPALGTPTSGPVKNAGNASAGMVAQPSQKVNNNNSNPHSDREELTPEQQKHFDYNQKQATVGATLKTLKGSAIKRSTKYGVGKEIGGEIYFHKDYAEDILPPEVLSQALQLLEEEHPGFEYNCLKYNPKTGVVAFQESPDFDTAREPVVGDYVSVNTDTGVVKTGHSNYIWHHKWNWVKNDYSGFDVEESWNWSKQWLSTLTEVSDGNGIERWNAQLDKFGLPHEGVMFSEREQEYDSKDTSVKILPATFTKFGLKATDRVLDWGGGQYDIAKKAVELGYPGIKFEVVDAFNRTKTHNDRILKEYAENPATVLTINNVLNVIKETDIIEDVIRESKEYLSEDGVCYIKIYEGNDVDGKTGNGKVTSSGWQNNQPAEWYRQFAEKYYQHVERSGDILIASDKPIDRKNLPKASKEATEAMRGKVKEIAKSEPSMRASLYSDRDNVGYHAGDLGKSEDFIAMTGTGRATGHFGTGTYFVGDEEQITDRFYGNRPHEKVNFDKYNLFKVRDYEEGSALHSFLMSINNNILHLAEARKTFEEYYDSNKNVMDAAEDTQFGEWSEDEDVKNNRKVIDEYIESNFTEGEKQRLNEAAEKDYDRAQNATVSEYWKQGLEADYKRSVKYFGRTDTLEEYVAYRVKSMEESIANSKKLSVEDWYYANAYSFLKEHIEASENYHDWYRGLTLRAMKSGIWVSEEKLRSILDSIYDTAKGYGYDGGKHMDSPSTMFMKALGYEGIDVRGVKGLDNTTYGSVIYDLKGEDLARKQTIGTALFQDRAEDSVSNRSLLANAFEGLAQSEAERNKIREYKEKIALINEEEKKLRELNAKIKELSFAEGKRDTKKINALRFDANQAANRINTYDRQLLRLEAADPLQKVLAREKKLAYRKAEQRGKEALAEYKTRVEAKQKESAEKWRESRKTAVAKARETAEKRDAREKLQKLVLDTVKWITYPAKTDVKCPDILKQPYADFLNGIDLSSKRAANGGDPTKNDLRLANAMDSLATALDRIMTAQDPSQDSDKVLDTGYLDLPADFVQKLRNMTEDIKSMMVEGDYVVNNMTAAEVRKLSQMIRTLNHAIKTMSKLYANLRFSNIEELGFDTMEFMDALGEIEKTGGVKDFVEWDNALPYYAFKRFGKGGESVFEGLMDAQDKLAFLAQVIFDFQEKTWTGDEAKAWSEDTHTITLPNGTELTLTTADAMSIYCLSRREQGLQHLLGGGTRVMGLQKGSKKAKDSRSLLTIEDVSAIISSLTDRQKQVAEGIQEFMSTVCSEWGNEISMKRFLTKEFTEKFYFPIESNDENLPTKDPAAQQSDLFRLLNISATKPLTPGANNEVIIRNIFDVFTGHASDMARLNAYGMALLDYMKWLNYREKTANEEGQIDVIGVRKSMEKAYGNAAKSYVLNLVKDVNGRPSDGGLPSFYTKMLRNAKTAMVGSSIRVATLQITSYPRAALVLSPKSLALGLSKMPNIEKAKKYCGIALWKSFGFYDTNISRSIEDQMKGVKDIKQKLIELSLKGAELGDAITWGALWNACEYEVASTKEYKVGTEEFYQAVGNKLREVVYRTQVVDSTLTRSEMMRSKNTKAQELSAFMSEPTLSANILMDAGFEFFAEKRRTGSAKAAWNKTGKYIGIAVAVHAIGQLTAALVESFWDAWRDDEDEEFWKKFLDAFAQNLVLDILPINKIPIISEFAEALLSLVGLGYFSADNLASTGISQTVSAVDAWKGALSGESSVTVYNALYKTTRAISSFFGVSVSGVMREAVALWNNTAGAYDLTLKILTYDRTEEELGELLLDAFIEGNVRQAESLKAEFDEEDDYRKSVRKVIKNRYEAGDIDDGTAKQYLIKYAGMGADKAYWAVQEWSYENAHDDDFQKFSDFYTAVQTGKNLKAVIKEYTDNGVDNETLAGRITSYFKPLYKKMSNVERASIKGYLLNAYELLGYDRSKRSKDIDKWLKD